MNKASYTPALRHILARAEAESSTCMTNTVTPEHVLAVLLDDAQVKKILATKYGADAGSIQAALSDYFIKIEESQFQSTFFPDTKTHAAELTELLEHAATIAIGKTIGPPEVLEAFMQHCQTPVGTILRTQSSNGYRHSMSAGIRPRAYEITVNQESESPITIRKKQGSTPDAKNETRPVGNYLLNFAANLNQLALDGKIDPVIGRQDEIEKTIEILLRRKKNNPIILGEAGVGKTALGEGLALRIAKGNVPPVMKNKIIFSLNTGALLAGTTLRGEFEERLHGLLNDVAENPDIILMIDEVHTLVGLGSDSGADGANLIKPALQNGQLRCIATTTYDEYRKFIEKDPALARRFGRIDLAEPTPPQTLDIVTRSAKLYEDEHHVRYDKAALSAAVDLAARYFPQQKRPDIVFDIIDLAGVKKFLGYGDNLPKRKAVVTQANIQATVAAMKKMPVQSISRDDRKSLRTLERDINAAVFDQEAAVKKLATAIRLNRTGLNNPGKPVGSFLFDGPTGVGKTEVAKQLAAQLGLELLRFDMSEYAEKHSIARLIGAPAGYVGYERGGLLTEAMDRHPRSVLLLDEIEKAHPDIYNLLLQAMDHGTMTDNNGKKIDFRHAVIIMTTNAGSAEAKVNTIGFTSQDSAESRTAESIARVFTPEFRNRLDATVHFHSLKKTTIEKIAGKFFEQLAQRAANSNVTLTWTAAAQEHLAACGFDPEMGARPMERAIMEKIGIPLSDEMIDGKLQKGGLMAVDFNAAALVFRIESRKMKKAIARMPAHNPPLHP